MPRILIPLESAVSETRVAATPETIKKFIAEGFNVSVQKDAGISAGFSDESYKNVGADLVLLNDEDLLKKVDIVLCVNTPTEEFLEKLSPKTLLIGLLNPYGNKTLESFSNEKILKKIIQLKIALPNIIPVASKTTCFSPNTL